MEVRHSESREPRPNADPSTLFPRIRNAAGRGGVGGWGRGGGAEGGGGMGAIAGRANIDA
jgi:hypothetical protein